MLNKTELDILVALIDSTPESFITPILQRIKAELTTTATVTTRSSATTVDLNHVNTPTPPDVEIKEVWAPVKPPKPELKPGEYASYMKRTNTWKICPASPPNPKYAYAVAMLADGASGREVEHECNLTHQEYMTVCRTQKLYIEQMKALKPGEPRVRYMQDVFGKLGAPTP